MSFSYDFMINEYRKGNIIDIRMFDLEFVNWFWGKVNSLVPVDIIDRVIEVGIANGILWSAADNYRIERCIKVGIGIPKRHDYLNWYGMLYREPVYKRVDVKPSKYVFCIDCVNDISKEDYLLKLFRNLMSYSTRYILLTAWAIDVGVPNTVRTQKKYYWDISDYYDIFKKNHFMLTGVAYYDDGINTLYIFENRI